MGQVRHGSATTTFAVRAAIQRSQASLAQLSGELGIEIMFGRLKDWRRIATRYDRCPKVFLSAVALAATGMFWP